MEQARAIWAETLASDGADVSVAVKGERVAATCMLITVPILLRGGRRLAMLDNVVSHPDFRRGGYGRAVVEAALRAAWDKDCFHVLVQSGRQDPAVHRLPIYSALSLTAFGFLRFYDISRHRREENLRRASQAAAIAGAAAELTGVPVAPLAP
jgi:GNAT superfamily N-acetyltransferase